jgi:hypothetical protein
MKYSIEEISDQIAQGYKVKFMFFWGHSSSFEGIDKTCFSQWYASPFTVNGDHFYTAEHWMMAQKARLFDDQEIYEKILKVSHPAEAKALGRKVRAFDAARWDASKYKIVLLGNYYKFSQHPELKSFLLNTNTRIIVEASPVDAIWGIGMAQDHPDVYAPHLWKGENLLGFALMELRDLLGQDIKEEALKAILKKTI